MFSCEHCGMFRITCFEEHLRPVASITCYFDTINLKQSGFCRTCYFKILVSEQKYKIKRPPLKIIQKIVNLKKKKKKQQFSCTLFLYKHMGKLGRSSICLRLAQFEPEIMLEGMLNFKTHFKI